MQVNPSGGASYTIDYSFDDPNDLISPIALGSMFFDTTMCPPGAVAGSAGLTFTIPTAPIWMRVRLLNGVRRGAGDVNPTADPVDGDWRRRRHRHHQPAGSTGSRHQ